MKIKQALNPIWANQTHTAINLSVNFEGFGNEFIPFTASLTDNEEYGQELFAKAMQGKYGTVAEYVAPPTPSTPVPSEISTRQFLIAAALTDIITEQEATDAATNGAVPALMESVFAQLPPDQAFAARITWAKMTVIPRIDPLVEAVGMALDMTSQQLDDFFKQAATI